jgi:hypothetical protein
MNLLLLLLVLLLSWVIYKQVTQKDDYKFMDLLIDPEPKEPERKLIGIIREGEVGPNSSKLQHDR